MPRRKRQRSVLGKVGSVNDSAMPTKNAQVGEAPAQKNVRRARKDIALTATPKKDQQKDEGCQSWYSDLQEDHKDEHWTDVPKKEESTNTRQIHTCQYEDHERGMWVRRPVQ